MLRTVPVRTKRWNDPADEDDGFRLLICRIRPRGVSKAKETWDEWWPDVGPSRELLAANESSQTSLVRSVRVQVLKRVMISS